MDIRDEKARLFQYLTHHAVPEGNYKLAVAAVRPGVEDKYIKRWGKQFYSKEKDFQFPEDPRLVNRFMLGADPEFMMCRVDKASGKVVYLFAEDMGYHTLGCFGSDMSGRQAELRAYPSRFALDVVASLTETLRWMAFTNEDARRACWQSTAYIYGEALGRADGFGGHVHFGRRRKDTVEGVVALDRLTQSLMEAGVLDMEGQNLRRMHTNYGKDGDFRLQSHGFEYRSMPTWLNSPQAAHLVLTVSKFVMLDKRFAHELQKVGNKRQSIINLLKQYRHVDDDARIALRAIELLGFPIYTPHYDFKAAWGISNEIGDDTTKYFFPHVIEGHAETKKQLFDWFVHGQRIPLTPPQATWTPIQMPKEHYLVRVSPHVMGIPEIAQGLVSYKYKVEIVSNNSGYFHFKYRSTFPMYSLNDFNNAKQKYSILKEIPFKVESFPSSAGGADLVIYAPRCIYDSSDGVDKDVADECKRFLWETGLLPIARCKDIGKLKDFQWPPVKPEPKKLGRIVNNIKGGMS